MATTPGAQLAGFKGNEQNIQFNGEPNAITLSTATLLSTAGTADTLKLLTYANLNPVMLIYPLDRLITGFAHCD